MNSEDDNTFLMAQLFAFMAQGKQAVITGEQFQRAQPKTYLFQDRKPKDFEKRLEAILERDHQLPEIYAERTL